MTIHSDTSAQCPHCKRTFDARKAILSFPGTLTGKRIFLVFALCPDCYEMFKQRNTSQQSTIVVASFTNFLNNPYVDWTITSSIALHAYSYDFFNAWWCGIDIPESVFDAINDGLVNEIVFPPSLSSLTGGLHA